MNQTLNAFDESQIVYTDPSTLPHDPAYFKQFMSEHHVSDQPAIYATAQEMYSTYSQFPGVYGSNDMTNHFSLFDALPAQVDPLIGMTWDNTQSDAKHFTGFKAHPSSEYTVSPIRAFSSCHRSFCVQYMY